VERFGEALDTTVDCFVVTSISYCNNLKLVLNCKTRGSRTPFSERDLRMSEDRAGLTVERAVAILTQISLKMP